MTDLVQIGLFNHPQEANLQNPADASVWGWIALLCLRTSKREEYTIAISEAKKLGLSDANLIR
jgi:hypothetical protein